MAILSMRYKGVIVHKVGIPGDLVESVSGDAVSHWNVPKMGISRPVVSSR